jgi:hypothetical protein
MEYRYTLFHRKTVLSAQTAHAVWAQRDKALSSTPCGFMKTQTWTSKHAQSHHHMREVSFILQLPSEYKTGWLPQYNIVINLDNWVLSQVTYCVEMQCVRHMFIYDRVVTASASHWEVLGSNVEASYPDARYMWQSSVSPWKWLDTASI